MEVCEALVAIDFGTSNIGYAFSFPADEDEIHLATNTVNSPDNGPIDGTTNLHENTTLQEGEVPLVSSHISKLPQNRVPPVMLLNADGTVNAFGKQAIDRYAQLVVTKRHQGFRYFDTFKGVLYRKFQSIFTLQVQDKEGRKMSALELFSQLIRYVGKLALQSIRERATSEAHNVNVNPGSVFWVLSVSAIWSDTAVLFMREAATEAGIPRDKLRLVREPEAVAFFWKSEMKKSVNTSDVERVSVGNKYIIADLGGGIVDICAHEILPDDRLREIFQATGSNKGGNHVDEMFIQFLRNVVGEDIWHTFCRRYYFDFVKLMRDFEELKRNFDCETGILNIELPSSLIKLVEHHTRASFAELIKDNEDAQDAHVEANTKLHIKSKLMESFFKPSIDGIVELIQGILQECNVEEIKTLLLAGGFSRSPHVQKELKREFSSMAVIPVPEQDLAVLKGAVLMGYAQNDLVERRARYTYGFAIARPFDNKRHPKHLRFIRDGKVLCRDIFHKLISKDQLLRVGDRFTIESRNNERKFCQFRKREACAQLFISTADDPTFCSSEDGCAELFITKIEAPRGGWSDRLCIDYFLVVEDSGFTVQAFDVFSGRQFETRTEIM